MESGFDSIHFALQYHDFNTALAKHVPVFYNVITRGNPSAVTDAAEHFLLNSLFTH